MAEAIRASLTRQWAMRAAYAGLMLLIMMYGLLPLDTLPRVLAGPDLALALTLLWCMRRPDIVPSWLIAGLFLLADLLLMRPPGLMAALVVFVTGRAKRRARALREQTMMAEWLNAGIYIVVVLLGFRLALSLFLLDKPQLLVTISQIVATVAVYPLLAWLSLMLFGLRRTAMGEVDSLGHRI